MLGHSVGLTCWLNFPATFQNHKPQALCSTFLSCGSESKKSCVQREWQNFVIRLFHHATRNQQGWALSVNARPFWFDISAMLFGTNKNQAFNVTARSFWVDIDAIRIGTNKFGRPASTSELVGLSFPPCCSGPNIRAHSVNAQTGWSDLSAKQFGPKKLVRSV